jgi:hypothetical protein
MQLAKSWWFWLKQSWRLLVIALVLELLVRLPARLVMHACADVFQKMPAALSISALLVLLLMLPWYTFLLTRLVAFLWAPGDLYDALRLYTCDTETQTTKQAD